MESGEKYVLPAVKRNNPKEEERFYGQFLGNLDRQVVKKKIDKYMIISLYSDKNLTRDGNLNYGLNLIENPENLRLKMQIEGMLTKKEQREILMKL